MKAPRLFYFRMEVRKCHMSRRKSWKKPVKWTWVLSRVMRKYNSVTYEVGKAKAEQAAGMFGLAAGQRAASCPSRVAKPLAKPLTGGWRSATYARSQQSAPRFSRSICSSDFMLM